jgi:hypothetical protein
MLHWEGFEPKENGGRNTVVGGSFNSVTGESPGGGLFTASFDDSLFGGNGVTMKGFEETNP